MLIRLRWGLFYSILGHSAWNFLGVMMMLSSSPDSILYQSDNLSIHLEKDGIFSDKGSYFNQRKDTLSVKHAELSRIVEHYFDAENLKLSVKTLDVSSYSGRIITKKIPLTELSRQLDFDIDTVALNTTHYVISDSLQDGFSPIHQKDYDQNKLQRHVLSGFKVARIIKTMAWDDNARVHINFTDSILDTNLDNFEYHSGYDFIGKMQILSKQLDKHWYYKVYKEEEDTYILKEQDISETEE